MSAYVRTMLDMYIKKEYRGFITEVYQNKDWRLFPDPQIDIAAGANIDEETTELLFSPDRDDESTWDENTGRLRLNIEYDTDAYKSRHCFNNFTELYINFLPRYCEDDKMCFYAAIDKDDETTIYDLKHSRQATLDYNLKTLCDDISDYEKLSDKWENNDKGSFIIPVPLNDGEDKLTEHYVVRCNSMLKRATKAELETLSAPKSIFRPIELDELIDEDGTFDIPEWLAIIDKFTFRNCSKLRKLICRNCCLKIERYAFAGCTDLEEIIFLDPNKPYGTLVEIERGAFSGCLKLKKVHLPKLLRPIRDYLFFGCVSLEEVIMPVGTEERLKLAASRGISTDNIEGTIYDTAIWIEHYAFSLCRSLKTIIVPEGTERICSEAFSHCTSLEEISLPSTLQEIENEAFLGCTSLRRIDIPNRTYHIHEGAFNDCTALSEITLPPSVDIIGRDEHHLSGSIAGTLSGHILHRRLLEKHRYGSSEERFEPLDGVTIKCAQNSPAEFYARYNKIKYEIYDMGDEKSDTYIKKLAFDVF